MIAADLTSVHVEVVNDDTNEEVQREERPEYDKHNEVEIHVRFAFEFGLLIQLK